MASFVLGHLMNGVVDCIETCSLSILGNTELILAGTSLCCGTLLEISLRIPYTLTQQLSKLRSVLSLFESIAFECLGDFGITLTVSLT